jgi:exopolysaccharide production protein ExoQ
MSLKLAVDPAHIASARLTPAQRALLNINRNVLIYIILLFYISPPALSILAGRYDASASDSSGSLAWQALELFIFVNSIILARFFSIPSRLIFSCLLPLACMLIWVFLSVMWSDYPSLTMRRGSRLVIEMILCITLALSVSSAKELLRIMFRAFFVFNLLDLISIVFPTVSFTPVGFAGIHGHKNLAGEFFFLALPVFFIGIFDRSISRSRVAAILAFLSAGGMLVISGAKTAIGAIVFAILLVAASRMALSRSWGIVYLVIFGLVASAVFLVLSDVGLSEAISYFFEDASLTGRDIIWRYAFQVLGGRMWTGVGYGALWQFGEQEEAAQANAGIWGVMNEAHNGYIEILAQVGIPGIVFLIFFLLVNFVRTYRFANYLKQREIFGLADYAIYILWGNLLYNITESCFFMNVFMWFILVFVLTAAAGQYLKDQTHAPTLSYVSAQRLRRKIAS